MPSLGVGRDIGIGATLGLRGVAAVTVIRIGIRATLGLRGVAAATVIRILVDKGTVVGVVVGKAVTVTARLGTMAMVVLNQRDIRGHGLEVAAARAAVVRDLRKGVTFVLGEATLLECALKFGATDARAPVIWHAIVAARGGVIAEQSIREVHHLKGVAV